MLVTLKEILKTAEENKCAIGSFNTPNMTSAEAVIAAAEELQKAYPQTWFAESV